jgi:hypothetical protein
MALSVHRGSDIVAVITVGSSAESGFVAVRVVPAELVERLRAAVEVEQVANSREQQLRAVAATGRLLHAARLVGWRPFELADAAGLNKWTVAWRCRAAAAEGHAAGIVVPPPSVPVPQDVSVGVPLAEREWLNVAEVCRLLGVAYQTLAQWRTEGLTPGAELRGNRWWFPQADVRRIRDAPRRQGGVDRQWVQHQISRGRGL